MKEASPTVKAGRRMCQPMTQANCKRDKMTGSKSIARSPDARSGVAGVLDVVPHGERHKTHVVGAEIESAGLARGCEHTHPSLPYDIDCHSSVFGCHCSSRSLPGSTSTSAAAMVFDTGNSLVSVIRTVPLLVR